MTRRGPPHLERLECPVEGIVVSRQLRVDLCEILEDRVLEKHRSVLHTELRCALCLVQ
jgi:hypothetical protein